MEAKGIAHPEKELPTKKQAQEEPALIQEEEQGSRQVKRVQRLNSELECTMRHTIVADELHENALQLRSHNVHTRQRANA